MNFLLVGDADSVWLKSVIENTIIPYGDKVTVLSLSNEVFVDFYNENNVTVKRLKKHKGKFGTLFVGLSNVAAFKHRYDVIDIHFLSNINLCLVPVARLFCSKLILSAWGSDVLKRKRKDFFSVVFLKFADIITLNTEKMRDKFNHLYGMSYDKKIRMVRFGSPSIEYFRSHKVDENNVFSKYKIDKEKVIVSIGYNTNPDQQHLKVLKCIDSLSKEKKDKIHILLRLTYGSGDSEYVNRICETIKTIGCTFSVFRDYLSEKDLCELTKITDIFVHSQISDAMSASMCEHIYSNCLVINPRWLKYDELDEEIFYLKFTDFSDLKDILKNNIYKKQESRNWPLLKNNSKKIYNIISWNSFVENWRYIYNE